MQVSVAPKVGSGRPPPPQVQFQDLKGQLYVADDMGKGRVANVRPIGDGSGSAMDVVLDASLLDVPIGRHPVVMSVLKDVFFYDMLGWLVFTFAGGILFAITSRITPLLHPVALPVAIVLFSLLTLGGYVAAVTVSASTLWTPIALVSAGLAATLFAVDMRIVAPIWFFLIQWAVSLSVLLYVVRVREHVDLWDLRKILAATTVIMWLVGLVSIDRSSLRDIVASLLLAFPCALASFHRYWWIPRIVQSNEFTVNDGLAAWENLYTQPGEALLQWMTRLCCSKTRNEDADATTVTFSPGPEL